MTEQQYIDSIAIYNPNGGQKAGKLYDVKNSNDLNVSGGGGTYFDENGDLQETLYAEAKTVVTNGKKGFQVEDSQTNYNNYSYDLRESVVWLQRRGATVTLDQVGIAGQPNTASLVSDVEINDYAELQHATRDTPTGIVKASVWIKKDSNQSRFPEIIVDFGLVSGGTEQNAVQLNTATGELGYRISSREFFILDRKDWWELVIFSSSEATSGKIFFRPALGTALGTYSNTATGGIIIGHVGVTLSETLDETPIITNGSTVTRTGWSMDGSLNVPSTGNIYLELMNGSSGGLQFDDGTDNNRITFEGGAFGRYTVKMIRGGTEVFSYTTGNNTIGETSKIAISFNNSTAKLFVNAVKETEQSALTPNITNFRSEVGGSNFEGVLYDLRVSEVALPDAEGVNLTTV